MVFPSPLRITPKLHNSEANSISIWQQGAKPFVWTADPDAIIEKVRRAKQVLESLH
jgi:hypothetical protein